MHRSRPQRQAGRLERQLRVIFDCRYSPTTTVSLPMEAEDLDHPTRTHPFSALHGDESGYDKGNPYNLIGDHCYTVTNVYSKNGKEYVSLNNPWGLDQPQDIPLSALPKVSDNIAVGTDPSSNTILVNTH
jgi:hypothetical protein